MISCLVSRAFSLVGNMCLRTSRIASVPDRNHLPTVDSDMWILSPVSYRYVPVPKDLRHSKSSNMGVVHSWGFFYCRADSQRLNPLNGQLFLDESDTIRKLVIIKNLRWIRTIANLERLRVRRARYQCILPVN